MEENEESIKTIENILVREVGTILSLEEDITPTTSLSSVGMDSIRFVELMIFVEGRFDVELTKAPLTSGDVKDVASLARLICSAMSGRSEQQR